MERGKALSWCLLLLSLFLMQEVSCGGKQEEEEACAPSWCGNITNISHPFRLRDDPANCGDPIYELACENNVTVLHLDWAKYNVLGINYSDFTIRLLDPGIQLDNCSSLPRYFFSLSNFIGIFSTVDSYDTTRFPTGGHVFEHIIYLIYLNCSDPVRDDPMYVETTPCVDWDSEGHIYAFLGDLLIRDLKDQCQLKSVAPITWGWVSLLHNNNFSYADIHRVLTYGFELSWWRQACEDLPCESLSCHLDPATSKLACNKDSLYCESPLGIISHEMCGNLSKPRVFAEDYLYGIYKGLLQIVGQPAFPHDNDSDFGLTQLGLDLGVFTGRFLLPYLTVKFLFGIIFLSVLLIYTCRRRHLSMYENIESFLQDNDLTPIRYSYKEIKNMTGGFKDKLGEGGFGTVYKGKLRSGPHVAIKMLGKSKANGQDFISEVATIGRIHHVHVVRLVGFCVEGSKRALVYEFMPNGSLDKFIFSKEGSVPLSYEKIYEISLGVARGIAYLHHGCDVQILHFDIKPHNILLDDNFIPKVSDFGLARLYPVDDSIVTLTAARGTIGYMAPELFYKNIGGVSYKADVYSFGMLLMEMASRRKNLNPQPEHSSQLYFPFWIYDQFNEEKDIEMEDLTKEEKDLAKKMFVVALWCIQLKPNDRPSMNKVVQMLEAEFESLEMPPKPSLYPHETVAEDHGFSSDQMETSGSTSSTSYIVENVTDHSVENNA